MKLRRQSEWTLKYKRCEKAKRKLRAVNVLLKGWRLQTPTIVYRSSRMIDAGMRIREALIFRRKTGHTDSTVTQRQRRTSPAMLQAKC